MLEIFDDMDPNLTVNYFEDMNSDPSISHEDNINMKKKGTVCGKISDADVIVQLQENSEAEDGLSGKEGAKKIQKKLLPSMAEAIVHICEL